MLRLYHLRSYREIALSQFSDLLLEQFQGSLLVVSLDVCGQADCLVIAAHRKVPVRVPVRPPLERMSLIRNLNTDRETSGVLDSVEILADLFQQPCFAIVNQVSHLRSEGKLLLLLISPVSSGDAFQGYVQPQFRIRTRRAGAVHVQGSAEEKNVPEKIQMIHKENHTRVFFIRLSVFPDDGSGSLPDPVVPF